MRQAFIVLTCLGGVLSGCFPPAFENDFCDQYTLFPSVCVDGLVCCDQDPEIQDDGGICRPADEGCPEVEDPSSSG